MFLYLSESARTQDLDYLEPVGDVVSDQRLVVLLLIPEVVLVLGKRLVTLRRCALWPM